MPAQSVDDDIDRQQVLLALHLHLFWCQELQGEQIERTAQQIWLGFRQQLVVNAAMGVAGIPGIKAGGRGIYGFQVRHARSPSCWRNFYIRRRVFLIYD
ncbi:hypothetical protein D3C73_1270700 [compost metagenome]